MNLEDIQNDLYYLRLREGFSVVRYRNTTFLSEFLGDTPTSPKSFNYVKSRFTSLIFSLKDESLTTVLLMAYNLSSEYQVTSSLTERRQQYSKANLIHGDAVTKLEEVAIRELTPKLLNTYYTGSPLPERLDPIPIGSFIIDRIEDYVELEEMAWSKFKREVTITSLISSFTDVTFSMSFTNMTPLFGIEKVKMTKENGSITWIMKLDKTLSIGETYRIGFLLEANEQQKDLDERNTIFRLLEGDPYAPRFLSLLTIPTHVYRIEVQFDTDYIPHWIWRFRIEPLSTYIPEWSKSSALTLSEESKVATEFHHIPAGSDIVGICWRWVK